MASSSSTLMAKQKPLEDWEAVREHFTFLYSTNILSEVMILMERDLNFKASERQYKERINIWGLGTYKKQDKKVQLEAEDTAASENSSFAVSSGGDTVDHVNSADLSIPPSVNHTGQRHNRVSRLPRLHLQHEADAHDPPSVCNEPVSTFTTTFSNPEPSRSPTPPTRSVWPDYLHGDFFDASASIPGMAVLPPFVDSHDELETMGITTVAQNGSSQAEPASETPGETDVGQSFGSSNKSSGTIDSNPKTEYDLVEGEYLPELYGVLGQQSSH